MSTMNPAPAGGGRRWRAGSLTNTMAGLSGLFFWLLWGDFGFYLEQRAIPPSLQILLGKIHVSAFVAGTVLGAGPRIVTLLVAPVVAYISDRHRGRWGRRIPFLLVPTPLVLVGMLGLAFSPNLGRWINHRLGHWAPSDHATATLTLTASFMLIEVCVVVCNSIFIGLITDVVPRELIGRFFSLFRMGSLIAGVVFYYYIFAQVERHFVRVFLGVGLLYCVSFVAMCVKVKEGAYPPLAQLDQPEDGLGSLFHRFIMGVKGYCRDCFALPYYRWVFLSSALAQMNAAAINLFYIFYAQALHIDMATLGKSAALLMALCVPVAYPAGWLADRFHPLRISIVTMVLIGASSFAAFLFVHDATSYLIAFLGCGTLLGFWQTATFSLPTVLFPAAKFATFNSVMTVIGPAIGVMLLGPWMGWTIDRLHHEYRYTYLWGSLLAVLCLLSTLVVYHKIRRYGGLRNYVPPTTA